jgi:ATP-dependent helicase YprA (DUF1998 family)
VLDPIQLAQSVKRGLRLHVADQYKAKWDAIANRFVLPPEFTSRDDALMKLRGPYLQALTIPNWSSQSWESFATSVRTAYAPNGLHPALVEGLKAAGIKRLQRFQEEAVQRISDDKDTLVVAGTGRGKSESWLIPLFQSILKLKEDGQRDGTKVVIIYPTKALAQDQFRRIVQYLVQINRQLPPAKRVTVGIFDGDTPSIIDDRGVREYLTKAFREMDCPGLGSKAKCKDGTCRSNQVRLNPMGSPLVLMPAEEECQAEYDLSFIALTREEILERHVDILITNPDIINLHLLNINEPNLRRLLVEQPRFLVLDEVHIYNGIFGHFVAMLMRRLRAVRQHLGVPYPLRFIASSATVANKAELFETLGGTDATGAIIQEEPGSFPASPTLPPPVELTEQELDEDRLLRVWGGESNPAYEAILQALGLVRPGYVLNQDARTSLGEQILQKLTQDPEPRLRFLAELYLAMRQRVQTPTELREWTAAKWGLTAVEAEHLLANFSLLGSLAGILERRAHLFAWALDGYYGCAACGRVYGSPVGQCECGNPFVSRLAFCTHCGEEVLEVWACPSCHHAYPMVANRDGESLLYDPPTCQCQSAGVQTVKAYFHPSQHCQCGAHHEVRTASICPNCEAWAVPEGNRLRCTSPVCDWEGPAPTWSCPSCGETKGRLEGFAGHRCPTCGELSAQERHCGTAAMPALRIPFVCATCGRKDWEGDPSGCRCGKPMLYWAALLEPTQVIRAEAETDWLPGTKTGEIRHVSFTSLRLADRNGRLVEVTKALPARGEGRSVLLPCHHPHTTWRRTRFDSMVRTPENILATGSQILLRTLVAGADDTGLSPEERLKALKERLMMAKMLTFSDSFRDMENVNRNFNEPERRRFLEASLVHHLREEGTTSAEAAVAAVLAGIEAYGRALYNRADDIWDDLGPKRFSRARRKRMVQADLVSLIRGGNRGSILQEQGVLQVRLQSAMLSQLSAEETAALGRFWKEFQGYHLASPKLDPDRMAIVKLMQRGVLIEEAERLQLNLAYLEVGIVSDAMPGRWRPATNRFVPEIAIQLGQQSAQGLVRYAVPIEERIDPDSRFFHLRLYELIAWPPALLTSRVYKGDTSKEERRQIEYQFKTKPNIHHISSGPAMEVGIDVGNLNAMALYGTPPNINGYLQRIGRAGRRSKRSLIMTVSKSNPIDYFYYRFPSRLIQSVSQPVPLTDQNREVLKIALTWAILDYIACHYWIPWEESAQTKLILNTGLPIPLGQEPPRKPIKFSQILYSRPVSQLDNGASLKALSDAVSQDRLAIVAWLGELVGDRLPAAERAALVQEVIDGFKSATWAFVREQFEWLDQQLERLDDERSELRKQIRDENDPEARARLEAVRTALGEEIKKAENLREELKQQKLIEVQKLSSKRPYAYSIRSIAGAVQIERRGPAGEEEGAVKREALPARDLTMALVEYHPFAHVLIGEQPHVVTAMEPESFATLRLRERFGRDRLVCFACGALQSSLVDRCEACGSDQLQSAPLVVPGRVVITPVGQRLFEAEEFASRRAESLYPETEEVTQVEKTIPTSVREVGEAGACRQTIYLAEGAVYQDNLPADIAPSVTLDLVPLTLGQFVPSFTTAWENGQRRWGSLLTCCGEKDCTGLISHSPDAFCSQNPTHDPRKGRPVIIAHQFSTIALRIRATGPNEEAARLAHSLSHGLRLALQEVAGVDVRMLGEIRQGSDYFLYEDVEGGYGILDLLLKKDEQGELPNLQRALAIIAAHTDGTACGCQDGCPICLYQYGCCDRNRPQSLTRTGVHGLTEPFKESGGLK